MSTFGALAPVGRHAFNAAPRGTMASASGPSGREGAQGMPLKTRPGRGLEAHERVQGAGPQQPGSAGRAGASRPSRRPGTHGARWQLRAYNRGGSSGGDDGYRSENKGWRSQAAWEEWVSWSKQNGETPKEAPAYLGDLGSFDEDFLQPSNDLQELCQLQLEMVGTQIMRELAWNANQLDSTVATAGGVSLTVFIRTPESFKSGELELQKAAAWPAPPPGKEEKEETAAGPGCGSCADDAVVLLAKGEEAAHSLAVAGTHVEGTLAAQQEVHLPGCSSVVLPMARGGCLMGLVVAERLSARGDDEAWRAGGWEPMFPGAAEESLRMMAQVLARAAALEQRALMSQLYAQQRGLLLDGVVAQVRAPLMALRTMGSMLLGRGLVKEGEPGRDMVQGMMDQGDRLNQVVEQLQEALFPERRASSLRLPAPMPRGGVPSLPGQQPPPSARDTALPKASSPTEPAGKSEEELELGLRPFRRLSGDEEDSMWEGERGALEDIQHCELGSVLRPILRAADGLAQHGGVALLQPDVPDWLPPLAADHQSLRQALSNALDHALRLTPRGGTVSVEVEPMVDGRGEGKVSVRVEGTGPSLDELQKQDALTLQDQGQGQGQGLAIARLLLEGMGGTVRLSRPHETFWAMAGATPGDEFGGGGHAVDMSVPLISRDAVVVLSALGRVGERPSPPPGAFEVSNMAGADMQGGKDDGVVVVRKPSGEEAPIVVPPLSRPQRPA